MHSHSFSATRMSALAFRYYAELDTLSAGPRVRRDPGGRNRQGAPAAAQAAAAAAEDAVVIRRRISLPRAGWPEADWDALEAAFAKEDRFHRGPAAHWAPTTRRAVEVAYARWLGFLVLYAPAALAEHPVKRLTEDRLTL